MGWPGPLTHRQYETWQAWLEQQWNEPSRTDHYLMSVARMMCWKDPPPLDKFKINFRREEAKPIVDDEGLDGPPGPMSLADIAKAVWVARLENSGPRPMKVIRRTVERRDDGDGD